MKRPIVLMLGVLSLGMMGTPVPAQFSPFDLESMDTLNGAPTGGASESFNPTERARGAVGATNARDPFGGGTDAAPAAGGPGAAPPPDPFGGGGGAFAPPAGDPFGGAGGAFAPPAGDAFGATTAAGVAAVAGSLGLAALAPTSKAWGGERVLDARTGQILQDGREMSVLDTFVGDAGRYKDDGKSFNDGVAADGIYTNITVSSDQVSPESHVVRSKMIKTLEFVSELSPMEFNQVRVATTEPLSSLPRIVDLEMTHDKMLGEWMETFLGDYMNQDEDGTIALIPAYMPPPPRAPNIPLPTTFMPTNPPTNGEGNAAGGPPGGGGGGGGLTGAVRGRMGADEIPRQDTPAGSEEALGGMPAQSRYF